MKKKQRLVVVMPRHLNVDRDDAFNFDHDDVIVVTATALDSLWTTASYALYLLADGGKHSVLQEVRTGYFFATYLGHDVVVIVHELEEDKFYRYK